MIKGRAALLSDFQSVSVTLVFAHPKSTRQPIKRIFWFIIQQMSLSSYSPQLVCFYQQNTDEYYWMFYNSIYVLIVFALNVLYFDKPPVKTNVNL